VTSRIGHLGSELSPQYVERTNQYLESSQMIFMSRKEELEYYKKAQKVLSDELFYVIRYLFDTYQLQNFMSYRYDVTE